jgi:hypothetical protein
MAEEPPRRRHKVCRHTPEIKLSIHPPHHRRLASRSVRSVEELRRVIEQEWERVILEEINEWIDEMLSLMNEVCERGGRPIVCS